MDKTDRIFIKILSNYINKLSCSNMDFSEMDMERLRQLIKIHRVAGMSYSCLKECNIDDNFKQQLELGFYAEIARFHKRNRALEEVKMLFNNHNMEHICVKGSYIAQLYPDPELRTMSDIDMLIKEKDRELSHKILLDNGAEYKAEESDSHVRVYRYRDTVFEIHTNLISEELWMNGVEFQKYYVNAFEHGIKDREYTLIFDKEFNVVYTITHIAKHFYHSGCGIRMLMDIPVLIRNSEKISWDLVWNEFEKLNLTAFAAKIFVICEDWFGKFGVEYPKKYPFAEKEIIEDFILGAGVYGFYGRNVDADRIKHFGNTREGGDNYFRGMIRWAFPSYSEMRQYSEWYRNKPAVLLPIAYMERFIRNAKERGGVMKWGRNIAAGSNDLKEKQVILSLMNLK